MDLSQSPSNGPRVVGRYMLFGEIASGGMATVRFGRLIGEVGFSRTVAVKCLHAQYAKDEEFARMFLDEARLAARVRHPNVVPILDVVAREGELFLVMDYVQGESLSKLVRTTSANKTQIPPRIVAGIISGLLDGLHAAHEAKSELGAPLGIVHRDVSPQNVIVGLDGVSRVLDFGVAKAAGRLQTTRDGQLKGKISYMAPEQLKAEQVDRRTDIYAASVVLWETLTGQRLFKADDEVGVFGKVLSGDILPPSAINPAIPQGFDIVTLQGLNPNPEKRFSTAREMAIALERVVGVASSREIGAWVEELARETLRRRADKVAELESASTLTSPQLLAMAGAQSQIDLVSTPSALSPLSRPTSRSHVLAVSVTDSSSPDAHAEFADGSDASTRCMRRVSVASTQVPKRRVDSPSQHTSLSMTGQILPSVRKPGVLAAIIMIVGLLALGGVILVRGAFRSNGIVQAGTGGTGPASSVAVVRSVDPQAPAMSHDASGVFEADAGELGGQDAEAADPRPVEPSSTKTSTPKTLPTRTSTPQPPPTRTSTAQPPPTKTSTPEPPPTKTSTPEQPEPPPTGTFTARPPRGNCDPPYSIDARGVRVPKMHCL